MPIHYLMRTSKPDPSDFILTVSLQALLLSTGMSYATERISSFIFKINKKLRALLALDYDTFSLLFIFNISITITQYSNHT
jgi:hypothetical protein